jgi:hypothetical protein
MQAVKPADDEAEFLENWVSELLGNTPYNNDILVDKFATILDFHRHAQLVTHKDFQASLVKVALEILASIATRAVPRPMSFYVLVPPPFFLFHVDMLTHHAHI